MSRETAFTPRTNNEHGHGSPDPFSPLIIRGTSKWRVPGCSKSCVLTVKFDLQTKDTRLRGDPGVYAELRCRDKAMCRVVNHKPPGGFLVTF